MPDTMATLLGPSLATKQTKMIEHRNKTNLCLLIAKTQLCCSGLPNAKIGSEPRGPRVEDAPIGGGRIWSDSGPIFGSVGLRSQGGPLAEQIPAMMTQLPFYIMYSGSRVFVRGCLRTLSYHRLPHASSPKASRTITIVRPGVKCEQGHHVGAGRKQKHFLYSNVICPQWPLGLVS
jgi:hypothetical protein